ncbi:hypothetical protein LguiB_018105 [Lonicera macranthoides]
MCCSRNYLKTSGPPEHRSYTQQMKVNAEALASALWRQNCKLATSQLFISLAYNLSRLYSCVDLIVDIFRSLFRFCAGKLKLGLIMWTGSVRDAKGHAELLVGGCFLFHALRLVCNNYKKVCEICHITLNKNDVFREIRTAETAFNLKSCK